MSEKPTEPSSECSVEKRKDNGSESVTRLVAPIFAAFSLATIIAFVSSSNSDQPWHAAILSFLAAATGLFMASIQLSIGRIYDRHKTEGFRHIRAGLTFMGIVGVTLALFFSVYPMIHEWWGWLAVASLLAGGIGPSIWTLYLFLPRSAATKLARLRGQQARQS
jgi:MFS family permease